MNAAKSDGDFPFLEVHSNHSVLRSSSDAAEVFHEGPQGTSAQQRATTIREAFDNGFLDDLIRSVRTPPVGESDGGAESHNSSGDVNELSPEVTDLLEQLVNGITSERGRALVAITVMQLSIKSICPEQSIRLHKGGQSGASFGWCEGISMRVLDKNYVTPSLREHGLLELNADGFMMTRSLAENYPYSRLYKAALRGPKHEWLSIVELLENGSFRAEQGLQLLISLLLNQRVAFAKKANAVIDKAEEVANTITGLGQVTSMLHGVIDSSTYSARLFEVCLHSMAQVLDQNKCFGHFLKPLTQMRSANKKHGNIGDIELTTREDGGLIIESWDAKFGKTYLRDELEELADKLEFHSEVEQVGFVVDGTPNLKKEVTDRIEELSAQHGITLQVLTFEEWVTHMSYRAEGVSEVTLAREWLIAFVESLCQKRRTMAPIDEPCDQWLDEIEAMLKSSNG